SGLFHVTPFLYDGQLTMVIETFDKSGLPRDDEFRLVHLRNGQWADGRKILLPGHGRRFTTNSKPGQPSAMKLSPRASLPPAGRPLSKLFLSVASQEQSVHLFFEGDSGFRAYRSGFEFSDEDDGTASALAPENSFREVSGWESTGAYLIRPEAVTSFI